MRAIEVLSEEHDALRHVLDALERVLDRQHVDDFLEGELAFDALVWLERFADGLHQDREELGLFPRLAHRAPEPTRAILSDLVRWHAHERERLEQMRAQIEGAAYGDPWSCDLFTAAARAYVKLQRHHSDLEDAQILPLARACLTPEDDEQILAVYEQLERKHLRAGEASPSESAGELIAQVERAGARSTAEPVARPGMP